MFITTATMPSVSKRLVHKPFRTPQACLPCSVFNVEQFDPDPFMKEIGGYGLPWHEVIDQPLPVYEHE